MIAQTLRGVAILVVDGQSFRRDYVSDVLAAAGATVHGPFDGPPAAMEFLDGQASPTPMLACIALRGTADEAFLARLADRGISCVAVWREAGDPPPHTPPALVLRAPLAAFQIVEALAELHRNCTAPAA